MLVTHGLFKFVYKLLMLEIFRIWNIPYCHYSHFFLSPGCFFVYVHYLTPCDLFSFPCSNVYVHALSGVPRQNLPPICSSNHAVSSVACPLLHGHPFLSFLLFYLCSVQSVMPVLFYASLTQASMLSPFTFLSLFFFPPKFNQWQFASSIH